MKRCTVLTHVAFEDLGLFQPVLQRHDFAINVVDVPSQGVPTSVDDLWVVMGGPIGVYDAPLYPFLDAEIAAIKARLSVQAPVLGICLGAQLMAAAAGGSVGANPRGKEIGWSPVTLTAEGAAGPLRHLDGVDVLHWHGDIIQPPPGAVTLAGTDMTPCQAFAVGQRALGLQFHPEVTAAGLERWLVGNCLELGLAKMDIPTLRAANARHAPALAAAVQAMTDDWLAGAGW